MEEPGPIAGIGFPTRSRCWGLRRLTFLLSSSAFPMAKDNQEGCLSAKKLWFNLKSPLVETAWVQFYDRFLFWVVVGLGGLLVGRTNMGEKQSYLGGGSPFSTLQKKIESGTG